MSSFEHSDLAHLSIEQDGSVWPSMFLDSNRIELLRAKQQPNVGPACLVVDFGEVTIGVKATVTHVETSQLGCRLSLRADDESLWAYCLQAAKSNQLELPRLIAATRPGIGAAQKSASKATPFLLREWPKAATIVLALAVGILSYQRFFFGSVANATVATDEVLVSASGSGRVIFTTNQSKVSEGEPVAGIARSRSRDRAMESPCDCVISRRLVSKGSWVGKADPMIALSRVDAPRYVRILVPAADVPQLLRGGTLAFTFQDGRSVHAAVPVGHIVSTAKSVNSGLVEVSLDPGLELPVGMIGQLVKVTYAKRPAAIAALLGVLGDGS